LAVQLLKAVSPVVFTKSYARLAPLFERRDFLVLLPYELTIHLLSFLDEKTLATVAQVSKAWNKFASDNTVWKKIYFKRGWTVNQEMVDWYLRSAEHEDQWPLGPNGMQPRIHFEPESTNRGKRKMMDRDLKCIIEHENEDYDMIQDSDHAGNTAPYGPLERIHPFERPLGTSASYGPLDDVDMARSPDDDDNASSPISFPASPPALYERPRMPMYSLGSNLMTPPSMLRKFSQRSSPPLSLRIPSMQGGSSSSSASAPRQSRFFGHPRTMSLDRGTPPALSSLQVTPPGPIQVSSSGPPPPPASPTAPNGSSNGLHSPLATKSLWSVIRHGMMGVSGSSAWPSLHSHRHSDSGTAEGSSSNQHQHHMLASWLMHLPSPLTGSSSRHSRNSMSQPVSHPPTGAAAAAHAGIPSNSADALSDPQSLPLPRRIDFSSADAPSPSDILGPGALHIHCDPVTKQPMINWKFLCEQRTLLERNWNQGSYFPKELPGHTEGIYCIQFDDTKIVSGSRDNTIKIWDPSSGRCLRTYTGHNASVLCLQYDESRIVSGSSDTTIIVWDLENGKVVQRLTGHADSVLSLRFEKDVVVSCSKDRTVKIWKISTGEMIRTLSGHRAAVNAVQFSSESAAASPFPGSPRVVVSASGDKTIKIWSFETGECLRTLEGHARGIACIQFEGNIVVSGSSDRSIRIWDVARGECIRTLDGHDGLVRTLQFSGERIISGGYDETLKIWDRESGKLLANMDGRHSHRVFKLQFNESKIVSCSQDQKIIIWDFAVGVDTTFLM
ncbi:hypothetical protein BGX31_009658, partial [Mortierella sp. GBA43]